MATNSPANTPTGATGTVLMGQGAGVALALSTATYPATAGSSGNVITSNGTNFVSSAPASSGISVVTGQIVTATGAFTYTPTANMKYVIVELQGAGGGAGGLDSVATGCCATGSGGAGGYVKFILTAAQVGASLSGSVGAGGAGGAAGNNNGNAGGNTTLATTAAWTAGGGALGVGAVTAATTQFARAGGAGGTNTLGTGTVLVNISGGAGSYSALYTASGDTVDVGAGGLSFYGTSYRIVGGFATSAAGIAGIGYGSGGGPAWNSYEATDRAGGSGANGIAIFTEFC